VSEARDRLSSDGDRDEAVASLREHVAHGRLTLEEFSGRRELIDAMRKGPHRELRA
jgi:hypothetical protein